MRSLSCLALLAPALIACQAAVVTAPGFPIGGPDGGVGPGARARFEAEVEPLIDLRCASCHADAVVAPVFVDAADTYAAVMGYPGLVIPGAPERSSLIMKGLHSGPAWTVAEDATVRGWIEAEGSAGRDGGVGVIDFPHTTPRTLVEGENRLMLDGVGLPGAELTFTASRVALGMNLADLTLRAGSTPVYVSHPRFVIGDGTSVQADPEDRFAGVVLSLPPGGSGILASTALLVGFPTGGALGIGFEEARPESR